MSIKKRSKPKQYNQIHRLMKVKERTKRNVRAEMRRYNPNYSAIYSNVHTVRISQPVYQKELHMIFQKKQEMQRAAKEEYDKLYKKIIKSKKEKAKKNNDMIQYSDLNNKIYDSEEITSRNYFKKEYSERDNKVRHHSINNSCNTNSKHHQLTKDNNNQTIEKKEKIKANSSRSAIKLKGLSFDKALGRDNYILKKKKEKEIIIDYNPNYDFIRSNTKKTFVHYGEDKSNVRLRKYFLTRRAIFNYHVENGYSVIKIDQEEQLRKESRNKDDNAFISKLIGL